MYLGGGGAGAGRAEALLSLGNMGQPGCCHGGGSRSGTRVLPQLSSRPRCRAFCARRPHTEAGEASLPRHAAPEAAGAEPFPPLPAPAKLSRRGRRKPLPPVSGGRDEDGVPERGATGRGGCAAGGLMAAPGPLRTCEGQRRGRVGDGPGTCPGWVLAAAPRLAVPLRAGQPRCQAEAEPCTDSLLLPPEDALSVS